MNVEQRLLVAFSLSFVVLLVFQVLFAPPPVPQKTNKVAPKTSGSEKKEDKNNLTKKNPEDKKEEKKAEVVLPVKKETPAKTSNQPEHKALSTAKPFVRETPLLRITFHPQGASISSVVLKKFKNQEQTGDLELLHPFSGTAHKSFLLYDFDELKRHEEKNEPHDVAEKSKDPLALDDWSVEEKKGLVIFTHEVPEKKLIISKIYQYFPDKYSISLKILFQNTSKETVLFNYRLNGPCGITVENALYYRLEGMIAKLNENSLSTTFHQDSYFTAATPLYREDVENIHWIGIANKYFTALIHPDKIKTRFGALGIFPMARKPGQQEEFNLYSFLSPTQITVPGNGEIAQNYTIYLGPKDTKILNQYPDEQFIGVINYGWWIFAVFSKLFLNILYFFYQYIFANFGLAIIFLTILVKSILFPMDYKAQKSMMMLQKLQPEMNAIRLRYKGKKGPEHMQKQQQEVMELYRKNQVNPLGGCLPLFVQIPIFIGLYYGLSTDIALRQAFFGGWIQDLSMPDSLVAFDEPVNFLFFTFTGVHILPIIMVTLMVIQQKLQPKTNDPQQEQQRKMLMFVMIFMGLIFYNFPSGLVLYFICQSIIGLIEQKMILKHLKAQEAEAAK